MKTDHLFVIILVGLVLVVVILFKCAASKKGQTMVMVEPDSEEIYPSGILDAGSANPELYEDIYTDPFVIERLDTAYDFRQPRTDLPIGQTIRKMHTAMGHDISDFEIVTGLGSTNVLCCIFVALESYGPVSFWQQSPSYSIHQNICSQLKIPWGIGPNTIEIITSPNNPTGELMWPKEVNPLRPVLVHDAVQEWPVYGEQLRPGQQYDELTRGGKVAVLPVYSFTKSHGLASSRVGYALVHKTHWLGAFPGFIERYEKTLRTFALCGCIQGERIAATLGNKEYQNEYQKEYSMVRQILETRFDEMKRVLESAKFTILSKRGFPYVWVYRQGEVAGYKDTSTFFAEYMGLIIRDGQTFGATNDYCRLNIYQKEANWTKVLTRITTRLKLSQLQ
jgi:histidinol-phosphate/aromatic aminotransferase/cobyric acid decarboxylase-like protein